MAVLGNLLFFERGGGDLDDFLRGKVDYIRRAVDHLPEEKFANETDEQLVAAVIVSASVKPLEVEFDKAVAKVEETTVEMPGRFDYGNGDGRPVRVTGLRATKSIPFNGDPVLWCQKPVPRSINSPCGEVRGQTLVVGMAVPTDRTDEAKAYIDGVMAELPKYLDRQKIQIEQHNEKLPALALPLIEQRRARLGEASDLLKNLQE